MNKIKVGSVQINNGFSNHYYLPYSIGLLQAYILHNSKEPNRYDFQTTIYKRWLLNECVAKLRNQDVIFFSTYVWNENISLAIAREIKKLNNEVLIVDTGCLVAFTDGIEYDIKRTGGLKSMFFSGEGFFLTTLKGTGTVYLQSLPFSRLANRIISSAPKIGGRRKGEGSVLGAIGDMIDGR